MAKFYTINENSAVQWKEELAGKDEFLYRKLFDLVVTKQNVSKLQEFMTSGENKGEEVVRWINKCVYLDTSSQGGDWSIKSSHSQGLNLCHRAVKNNSRDVVKYLLLNCGADLSVSFLDITTTDKGKVKISTRDSLFSMIWVHFREPSQFMSDLLDANIRREEGRFGDDPSFTFDFSILCPSSKRFTDKQMNVLSAIVNSSDDIHCEQYQLLKHPLIETFLRLKWQHYRMFFFLLVFLHLSFVMCLSTGVVLMVNCYQWFHNNGFQDVFHDNRTEDRSTAEMESLSKFLQVMSVIKILNFLVFFIGIFLFIHAIIQASFLPKKKLFREFELVLNFISAPGAMITCLCLLILPPEKYFEESSRWIYHLISWIILTVWVSLMLLIGRFPELGCYSLMFTTVARNFLKVMISFIFLVIGFALSFSLMFPRSEFFKDPIHSTLRTIVMMVGEFDYTSTFSDQDDHFVTGTSRFIFLIFIITCSIILMNLTQGLAVNDIKVLHEISQEIRLEKETRFLYELECVFTHRLITASPFFRKIKRTFYDHGVDVKPITLSKNDRHGFSVNYYNKLMREFRKL